MKTAREQLDILTTYAELGSYRATATLCGTTHKTVRRVVERRDRPPTERPARPRVTDPVLELITAKVKRIPQWKATGADPDKVPKSPVTSEFPVETITLVPMGATRLRISAFPVIGD